MELLTAIVQWVRIHSYIYILVFFFASLDFLESSLDDRYHMVYVYDQMGFRCYALNRFVKSHYLNISHLLLKWHNLKENEFNYHNEKITHTLLYHSSARGHLSHSQTQWHLLTSQIIFHSPFLKILLFWVVTFEARAPHRILFTFSQRKEENIICESHCWNFPR